VPKNRVVATALLERDDELETLLQALAGGGRLVLLSGEAGVGKSSLARVFCEEHAGGARVLVGACDALQTPRPLGPFLDLAAGGARRIEAALEQAAKPYAIYAALVEELQRTRGRSIVLLEDLHWADDATLDVVRLLARRVRLLPGMVLATFRDDELAATHPVRSPARPA
jgi:predicted ATPase